MDDMIIAAEYSFNKGEEYVNNNFPSLLKEVTMVIRQVNAKKYFTKTSKEKTMKGKQLFSPRDLNTSFKEEFTRIKWKSHEMSSGVSYFEQFAWDLEKRGVADIDIPVLILGIFP